MLLRCFDGLGEEKTNKPKFHCSDWNLALKLELKSLLCKRELKRYYQSKC